MTTPVELCRKLARSKTTMDGFTILGLVALYGIERRCKRCGKFFGCFRPDDEFPQNLGVRIAIANYWTKRRTDNFFAAGGPPLVMVPIMAHQRHFSG